MRFNTALVAPLLALILAAQPTAALDSDAINFTVSEAPGLVEVSDDISTQSLLPGYEYNYTITVRWAVPADSIRSIDARQVKVYFMLAPDSAPSGFYFKENGGNSTRYYSALECIVSNGSCAPGSTLEKNASVYYSIEEGATPQNESISVRASTRPFADEETIGEVGLLLAELSAEPLDEGSLARLSEAGAAAENGDYGTALAMLRAMAAELPANSPGAAPTREPYEDEQNWPLLITAVAALLGIAVAAIIYFHKPRGKTGGIYSLDEEEVRGFGPAEPDRPLGEVTYGPAENQEKKEEPEAEPPVVTRVPDWF
jgi:hypothetical protein